MGAEEALECPVAVVTPGWALSFRSENKARHEVDDENIGKASGWNAALKKVFFSFFSS